MKREDIVKIAREWIGTPWVHQASVKGVGCDCVGMVRGVYTELTGKTVGGAMDYTRSFYLFSGEERLKNEIGKYCMEVPIGEAKSGDVILISFLNLPSHHIGILAGTTFIHSWEDIGNVVEIPYDAAWKRLTKAVFRFPEVED